MIAIGNHLSSSAGFLAMGIQAELLGADTFAFFTRNPRGGKAKAADPEDAAALAEFLNAHKFGKLAAHAPYTMNLCSDKEEIRSFAFEMLKDDLRRLELVPDQYYNLHPGSHVGQGVDRAIPMITEAVNRAMFPGMHTTVLFETMAGKGSEVGRNFEEISRLIEGIEDKEHIGVCLDTCHVWDSGIDIGHVDLMLNEFESFIGLRYLKAVHLNDSLNPCGARKDRHARIGEGCIGLDNLREIVRHPALQGLPFILETPNDDEGYRREIALVRSFMKA